MANVERLNLRVCSGEMDFPLDQIQIP